MRHKILNIYSESQLSITQHHYKEYVFENKSDHRIHADEIITQLMKTLPSSEFSEQILTDIIKEDLSGNELLTEFKKRHTQVKLAVEAMLMKAKNIASGKAPYKTYDDVFGAEN